MDILSKCGSPIKCSATRLVPHQWISAIQWQGITLQVMTFRVEAPKGAVVRWRRWGGSLLPYTSGRFSGTETFRIYPGELFLSFDLRADDPDLDVTIERVES